MDTCQLNISALMFRRNLIREEKDSRTRVSTTGCWGRIEQPLLAAKRDLWTFLLSEEIAGSRSWSFVPNVCIYFKFCYTGPDFAGLQGPIPQCFILELSCRISQKNRRGLLCTGSLLWHAISKDDFVCSRGQKRRIIRHEHGHVRKGLIAFTLLGSALPLHEFVAQARAFHELWKCDAVRRPCVPENTRQYSRRLGKSHVWAT